MTDTGPLSALATKYGSDKWGAHSYTPHYELHFSRYRDRAINFLEIGIGGYEDPQAGGSSLKMWRDYFSLANIVGLDFYDKSPHAGDRTRIYQGDQSDPDVLNKINAESGPFDIIIDDGSHHNEHVLKSFSILFPLLNSGGLYVIEDTQTSYWPSFGGSFTDLNDKNTSVGYMKSLVDGLNHREIPRDGYLPTYHDENIVQICFLHNMIFIYKGENREESNVLKEFAPPETYKFILAGKPTT